MKYRIHQINEQIFYVQKKFWFFPWEYVCSNDPVGYTPYAFPNVTLASNWIKLQDEPLKDSEVDLSNSRYIYPEDFESLRREEQRSYVQPSSMHGMGKQL